MKTYKFTYYDKYDIKCEINIDADDDYEAIYKFRMSPDVDTINDYFSYEIMNKEMI